MKKCLSILCALFIMFRMPMVYQLFYGLMPLLVALLAVFGMVMGLYFTVRNVFKAYREVRDRRK